jgi:adenosylcobinamide kinase/adenosylcobinamide-phosphate guanylyltransferase
MIVLVIGGTRSGKSEVAERVAARAAAPAGGAVTYVATGESTDPDMASRIARHRARRPEAWTTLEAPIDLLATLASVRGTVLVDSLGAWVASADAFAVDVAALLDTLRSRDGDTVIVSEEVGMSVHATTATGRRFADHVGATNASVAQIADDVLLVVAGRALRLESIEDLLSQDAR